MIYRTGLKRATFHCLVKGGADRLFRFVNRDKLLVVMYHGVTQLTYDPPAWTQLPVELFRSQLEFIRSHYNIISLECLLDAIRSQTPLPSRSALLTFDDGLMNNYTVAFPLLKEFDVPATIFLTSDYIGMQKMFWFDELYLLLSQLHKQGDTVFSLDNDLPKVPDGEFPYYCLVNWMKRLPVSQRVEILDLLRQQIPLDVSPYCDELSPLGWDEVKIMQSSGLVDFGAHTATHEILTNLDEASLHREVVGSREMIERHLNRPVLSFCYPNGRPGDDFTREHEEFIAASGFLCAFSTKIGLFRYGKNLFNIHRIPVGNDGTSEPDYFRLNAAGTFSVAREIGLN